MLFAKSVVSFRASEKRLGSPFLCEILDYVAPKMNLFRNFASTKFGREPTLSD